MSFDYDCESPFQPRSSVFPINLKDARRLSVKF